jgi:hypothetical protein
MGVFVGLLGEDELLFVEVELLETCWSMVIDDEIKGMKNNDKCK